MRAVVLFTLFTEIFMKENVAVPWERDITKDDKTISTAVGSFITVQSLTECVMFCGTTMNGAALFFNQNIGSCKCSDTQISPLHPLTPEIGEVYFVAQMCKVHGYVALMKDLCVKVFETQHSYDEAKEFCYKENGRLVRLDTFERIVMVRDYLVDVIGQSVTYNKVFYIDGRKSDTWRFSDGSEIKVFQWGPFEPSNYTVDECLSMFQADYLQGDTLCNGDVTGYDFGFICEILN